MSPDTRAEAKKKLSKITVKIGYPDKWRDYSALTGAQRRPRRQPAARRPSSSTSATSTRTGGPVDKGEWLMTPQTVNAYYNSTDQRDHVPGRHPAPPFFDMTRGRRGELRRHRRR